MTKEQFLLSILIIFHLGCSNKKIDYSQSQIVCRLKSIYGLDDLLEKGKKSLGENTFDDEKIEVYLDYKTQNDVNYLYVQSNYLNQGADYPAKYFYDIKTIGYNADDFLFNILYTKQPSLSEQMEYRNKLSATKFFISDDLAKTDFFASIRFSENIDAEVVSKKGKVIKEKFKTLKTQVFLKNNEYDVGSINGKRNKSTLNSINKFLDDNDQSELKKYIDNINIDDNNIKIVIYNEQDFFDIIKKKENDGCELICCIDKIKAISVTVDCGFIETEISCLGDFEISFKGLNQEYTIPITSGLMSDRSDCKSSRKYCFSGDGFDRGYITDCNGETFEGFHKDGVKFTKGNYSISIN